MCFNMVDMQTRFGRDNFDFVPDTYVLPDEFADFYSKFQAEKGWWIIKPCASSQGKGIYIVDNLDEVPIDESLIISRYVANPLLIKGLKFDLRIYVLVTCFEPLRIYMFEEGLARFASEPYRTTSKASRYMHLTNYSVNKKNSQFVQNENSLEDNVGHKWSMSALFKHLNQQGADVSLLWSRIYDLIIKTVQTVEPKVVEQMRKYSLHRCNCFDLYGFDVLIDAELKPWLMEVNLSPSLGTESPLDLHIKSTLIADALNLVGIRTFDRRKEGLQRVKARLRAKAAAAKRQDGGRTISPSGRQDNAKLREILKETVEEYERRGHFLRIFPASGTDYYNQFFKHPRKVNQDLYLALFEQSDVRWIDRRMEVVRPDTTPAREREKPTINRQRTESRPCKKCRGVCSCKRTEKLVITGDDILMEYISRLMHTVKALAPEQVRPTWRNAIEKFVTHYVWLTGDMRRQESELWQRLEARLIEMKERRRRLLAISGTKSPEAEYEEQKLLIIRGFTASQLEEMLRTSTKNVAQEVVSCLINIDGKGVLSAIIRGLSVKPKIRPRAVSDAPTDPGDEKVY
jgi:tubulin polyglutamylase TTLL5